MEFEEIGQVWREQGTGTVRRMRIEDLSSVLGRAKGLGAARRRRFARLAWVVAVPLFLLFGYMAWEAPNLVAAFGAVLLATFAAIVAVRYRAIGRGTSDAALPVRVALQAEVAHLSALERLRRDAPWIRALFWVGYGVYVLGAVVLEEDDPRVRALAVGLFLCVLLISEGLIYFARHRDPRVTWTLRDELKSWLDSLDELDAREANEPGAADHI